MAVNIFALSAICACGPAIVFSLLAIILPYMESGKLRVDNVTLETNIGLWRSCNEFGEEEICGDSLDINQWGEGDRHALGAARAMVLLGFFCTIPTLVLLLLFLSLMKERRIIGLVGGGLSVAGGVLFLISIAIFAGKLKPEGYDYTAGFAFDILSCFSAWTGAILIFLAVIRNTGEVSTLLI